MPLKLPENEDAILSQLAPREQETYRKFKAAAERVASKHPDMDTQIYTDYMSMYLDHWKDFKQETTTTDGKPVDPRYIEAQHTDHARKLSDAFDQQYPRFVNAHTGENAEAIKKNADAWRLHNTEYYGESWFERGVKGVYDQDKGGVQWASVGGGLIGILTGVLMGSMLGGPAAAAGMPWLGTVATVLLAGSGAVFFSKLSHDFFHPEPPADGQAPQAGAGTKPAVSEGKDNEPAAAVAAGQAVEPKRNHLFTPRPGWDAQRGPFGTTQHIPLIQEGDHPPELAGGKSPQMTVEGSYRKNGAAIEFVISNVYIKGVQGPFGISPPVVLEVGKNGSIDLASRANVEALNQLDDNVRTAMRGAGGSLGHRGLPPDKFNEIDGLPIMSPSTVPLKPATLETPGEPAATR